MTLFGNGTAVLVTLPLNSPLGHITLTPFLGWALCLCVTFDWMQPRRLKNKELPGGATGGHPRRVPLALVDVRSAPAQHTRHSSLARRASSMAFKDTEQMQVLSADCLHRHSLRDNEEPKTIDHLFLTCAYSREVWFKVLRAETLGMANSSPTSRRRAGGLVAKLKMARLRAKEKVFRLLIPASGLANLAGAERPGVLAHGTATDGQAEIDR